VKGIADDAVLPESGVEQHRHGEDSPQSRRRRKTELTGNSLSDCPRPRSPLRQDGLAALPDRIVPHRRSDPERNCLDEGGNTAGSDTATDARSEGRVGGPAQLIGEIVHVARRGTSRPRLRPVGRPRCPQDALHEARVLDEGQSREPPAAVWALEHVHIKGPPHQLGPQIARGRHRAARPSAPQSVD
jgi:hypothetical protein